MKPDAIWHLFAENEIYETAEVKEPSTWVSASSCVVELRLVCCYGMPIHAPLLEKISGGTFCKLRGRRAGRL